MARFWIVNTCTPNETVPAWPSLFATEAEAESYLEQELKDEWERNTPEDDDLNPLPYPGNWRAAHIALAKADTDGTWGRWEITPHDLPGAPAIPADVPAPEPVRWERKSPNADWTIVQPDDIPHYRSVGQEIRALYTEPPSDPLRNAAPDILATLDPETLEDIADEITNGDRAFLHSARAGSLRSIAKRQRAAIAKADGR